MRSLDQASASCRSILTRARVRDPQDAFTDPTRAGALHEVKGGQQQVFLGLGAHTQQVVVAEVSIHEREQVALGMLVAELLDHLHLAVPR